MKETNAVAETKGSISRLAAFGRTECFDKVQGHLDVRRETHKLVPTDEMPDKFTNCTNHDKIFQYLL
jgi:hypothetical protein